MRACLIVAISGFSAQFGLIAMADEVRTVLTGKVTYTANQQARTFDDEITDVYMTDHDGKYLWDHETFEAVNGQVKHTSYRNPVPRPDGKPGCVMDMYSIQNDGSSFHMGKIAYLGGPAHFEEVNCMHDQVSISPMAFADCEGTHTFSNGIETFERDTSFSDEHGNIIQSSHTVVSGKQAP